MESPEDFMKRYFAARTERIKEELKVLRPFREQFFTEDCIVDSRALDVEVSENEVVFEVTDTGNEARVATKRLAPRSPVKYLLVRSAETWLINGLEFYAEGRGWIGSDKINEELRALKLKMKRDTSPSGGTGGS